MIPDFPEIITAEALDSFFFSLLGFNEKKDVIGKPFPLIHPESLARDFYYQWNGGNGLATARLDIVRVHDPLDITSLRLYQYTPEQQMQAIHFVHDLPTLEGLVAYDALIIDYLIPQCRVVESDRYIVLKE